MRASRIRPPVHPGEILVHEFLEPLNLTPYAVAKRMRVPRTRIERVAAGKAPITHDTAARLGRVFGNHPQFWLNLQDRYELLQIEIRLGDELAEIEPLPLKEGVG